MERTRLSARTCKGLLVVVALLTSQAWAGAHGPDHGNPGHARAIEGVWLPIVTITDCQTKTVIASFPSMEIYVRGGGYVGFGAVKQADQVGMGAWRHQSGRKHTSEYQFFNYTPEGAPDGVPNGTLLRVSSAIRLGQDGRTFTSSDIAEVIDASGTVFARVCGHRTATRLQ